MQDLRMAKAEDWYAVQSLDAGISLISERYIDAFYRCNIWHVRGRDRDLLIDSGMGVVSLKASVRWLAERPVMAVASHCHFDHIGNHHEFDERVCHCTEAHVLAQPDAHETLADRFAVVEMFSELPPGGYAQQAYRVQPAPATRLVEDGDVIDLGDRQFQVLHVPGHSPGSIALWEASTGILFSGDCVYDGPLVDDAYRSCIDEYCESMERLRELPVSVVHGGHFPSFGAQRFRQLIDEYRAGKRAQGCPR